MSEIREKKSDVDQICVTIPQFSWGKFKSRATEDVMRVVAITLVGALLMYLSTVIPQLVGESLLAIQLYAAGAVFLLVATSHVTRRLLCPRLDYQKIGKEAIAGNLGAGLVFLGMSVLVCTFILVQAWFITAV